ncbi:MAG: DUF1841 family protein [Chromatiaceae bacterium]|nr:DUF1841 family protein [Gammaproteobacteria bacterium]MCP5300916.1 DUF1841 family protein [Chromatiaceae bacterium]MCP5421611.1 DUF1841 family protein [Chromatiaceae bacterium]
MFGHDREQLRRFFVTSWHKRLRREPLQALEQLVVQVIEQHPEYHAHLDDDALQRDFTLPDGETNPWLHMGMHISIGEQLGADRPAGIRDLYRQIANAIGDAHEAEHAMMDCLGRVLWEAQRAGREPDQQTYLDCLKRLRR